MATANLGRVRRRLITLDIWLQRNQWPVFVALACLAIAMGTAATWSDNPVHYAATAVRG